jgi:hypothetical protein
VDEPGRVEFVAVSAKTLIERTRRPTLQQCKSVTRLDASLSIDARNASISDALACRSSSTLAESQISPYDHRATNTAPTCESEE